MGIKTVPQPPYSLDLAPCYFWLFPKLRGCRYETLEEIKEVIDMLTQEDFHGAFQKLLERYNKCIAARGDYFEGDYSFNKSAYTKKSLEIYRMHLVYSICCEWQGYGISTIVGDLMSNLVYTYILNILHL